MQTAYVPPFPASASGATRTITMGRNRLNGIENWVKPPKPSKSRALHADRGPTPKNADETPTKTRRDHPPSRDRKP